MVLSPSYRHRGGADAKVGIQAVNFQSRNMLNDAKTCFLQGHQTVCSACGQHLASYHQIFCYKCWYLLRTNGYRGSKKHFQTHQPPSQALEQRRASATLFWEDLPSMILCDYIRMLYELCILIYYIHKIVHTPIGSHYPNLIQQLAPFHIPAHSFFSMAAKSIFFTFFGAKASKIASEPHEISQSGQELTEVFSWQVKATWNVQYHDDFWTFGHPFIPLW